MDKLYRETKSNCLQLNDLLAQFEKTALQDEANACKQRVSVKLNEIMSALDQLDIYVSKEPATRRYDAKIRVDQVKYDVQHLRAAFNNISYRKWVKSLDLRKTVEVAGFCRC